MTVRAKDFVTVSFTDALISVRGGNPAAAYAVKPTPHELHAIYARGFQGVRAERLPEARKKFSSMMEAMPDLYTVFPWAKGLGKGKVVAPYVPILQKFPDFGIDDAQARGDCFLAGTIVRMADGSERPIEQISVGEYVLSHTGKPQRVSKTIEKPYCGKVFTVKASGYDQKLTATRTHQFAVMDRLWDKNIKVYRDRLKSSCEDVSWRRVDELSENDLVLLTRVNVSASSCKFQLLDESEIELDERLAYLMGVYAAEGGIYKNRVIFSVGTHETLFIEDICQLMKDLFGVTCTVRKKSNCKSVTIIRGSSKSAVDFFSRMIPGNQWSKELPWQMFSASRSVKLAMLRGWMDGDGCCEFGKRHGKSEKHNSCRVMGVSVSPRLSKGMFDLANSCGLKVSLYKREIFDQTRRLQPNEVYLYGESAAAVYPDKSVQCKVKIKRSNRYITKFGIAAKVASVTSSHFEGKVYCIEVENDHSFIAEGYAVHNCTVHGTKHAASIDYGVDALFGETGFKGDLACENIYRSRGFNGDGWSCQEPCVYIGPDGPGGLLYRQVWKDPSGSESVDLSRYNPDWEGNGRAGVPTWMEAESKKNKVKYVIPITNPQLYQDALAAGFGINVCSDQGFSSDTDEWGLANAQGAWSHSMAHAGCVDTPDVNQKYGGMIGLILQSWGKWNTQNGNVPGAPKQPGGSFWAKMSVISNRMLGDDSFALCGVWGWDRVTWDAFVVADYKADLTKHLKTSDVCDRYEARAKWISEQTQKAVDKGFLAV